MNQTQQLAAASRAQPPAKTFTSQRGLLLFANLGSALESLWSNRVRSFLTILGIIVGISAVIAAVSLTQGTSAVINQRVSGLGTNVLLISPGSATTGAARGGVGTIQTLTASDANALTQVQHVINVSPLLTVSAQIIAGSQNWNTRVSGVYPAFQTIQNWQLSGGSWFSQTDEQQGNPVAVLGQTTAQSLFPSDPNSAIGQQILIRSQQFTVVGVLQAKGSNGAFNQDDIIYVPFQTEVQRLDNVTYVSQIQVQVDDANNVASAQTNVQTLLETLHKIPAGGNDDFQIRNPSQLVQTAQQFSQTLTILLVSIASISLFVGGIGIMNIMLVSVTERTREIGIRMAIGARRSDIRNQFLIEALTLSALGGVIGLIIGLLAGYILTVRFALPFVTQPIIMMLAIGVSAIVGIVFGFYPAVRASQLDPITALRTE